MRYQKQWAWGSNPHDCSNIWYLPNEHDTTVKHEKLKVVWLWFKPTRTRRKAVYTKKQKFNWLYSLFKITTLVSCYLSFFFSYITRRGSPSVLWISYSIMKCILLLFRLMQSDFHTTTFSNNYSLNWINNIFTNGRRNMQNKHKHFRDNRIYLIS